MYMYTTCFCLYTYIHVHGGCIRVCADLLHVHVHVCVYIAGKILSVIILHVLVHVCNNYLHFFFYFDDFYL